MTAEIAVMNKGAIALAADSKVTVTSGGVTKTYDTVSKLFTLSKCAPVGVMIYGNADFMGYPWETVIKLYRRQKGLRTEGLITDWAEDFFRFLESFGNVTTADKIEHVYNVSLSILLDILRRYHERVTEAGMTHGTPEYEEGLRKLLRHRAAMLAESDPWILKRQQESVLKRLAEPISRAISDALGDFEEETKKQALLILAATLLFKNGSPSVSGIVIAGFGEREYFPTLVEYQVDGYIGKDLKKYIVPPVMDISRSFRGCIRAFAQGEMVNRFMDGIDSNYSLYLSQAVSELVMDNCFETLNKYGSTENNIESVRQNIRDAVDEAVSQFERDAHNYRVDTFSDPVVRMVGVLPKDELAHLAESLVALTSLKRRVSSDAETVGGPVDVALISKGDGFVWIKRKHYFSEELNKQFVRRYMDDVSYGARDNGEPGRAESSSRVSARRPTREPAPGRARGKQNTSENG